MIQNGSPMGPGFLIFFNIQDTSRGFQRITLEEAKKDPDEDIVEFLAIVLNSGLLED